MRIDYSKPSADLKIENEQRLLHDKVTFRRQEQALRSLSKSKQKRSRCIVCNQALRGEIFLHRNIPFVQCENCTHIQLKNLPPKGYPKGFAFDAIYPSLTTKSYDDRKSRIYKPKLNWIIKSLAGELRYSEEKLKKMKWLEIGCGAGYFLSTLQDWGVSDYSGLDGNKRLADISNKRLGRGTVAYYDGNVSDSILQFPSDIYVAFFVLEHTEDAHKFFLNLKQLPKNTILIFSVPVFGLSTILDNVFEKNSARNLDAIVHTQLYTDESIQYAMNLAHFKIVAEWIFGQDAEDFCRYLSCNIKKKYSKKMSADIYNVLSRLTDGFQACLDRLRLSDQRHVIAIKK